MKLIVITGEERCDFSYYAAMLLHTASEKTVVIDNSLDKELFRSVQRAENMQVSTGKATVNGVTFLKDIAYSPEFFSAFDYVVIFQGENYDREIAELADTVYLMPDYKPSSIERSKNRITDNTVVVLHDKAGKITDKAVAEMLQIPHEKVLGGIPINEQDYNCYLSLLYNGKQGLKGLSNDYLEPLMYLFATATGKAYKDGKKAVRKAG